MAGDNSFGSLVFWVVFMVLVAVFFGFSFVYWKKIANYKPSPTGGSTQPVTPSSSPPVSSGEANAMYIVSIILFIIVALSALYLGWQMISAGNKSYDELKRAYDDLNACYEGRRARRMPAGAPSFDSQGSLGPLGPVRSLGPPSSEI